MTVYLWLPLLQLLRFVLFWLNNNIKCASFEFLEAIVNDDETDIVSYMDINETNASVTLNQKECDFFTSKDQLKAIKSEEEKNKKRRNTMEGLLQRMGLPKKCKSILKQEPKSFHSLHFYLKGILQPSCRQIANL
jgi:hypothetical protein